MRIRATLAAALTFLVVGLTGCEITTCTYYDNLLAAPSCGQGINLNSAPVIVSTSMSTPGNARLYSPRVNELVDFRAHVRDPDRDRLLLEWDFNGDGETDRSHYGTHDRKTGTEWRFSRDGLYTVTLRVSDFPQLEGGEGSVTFRRTFRVHTREQYERDLPPIPNLVASDRTPDPFETVVFDARGSSDPDGGTLHFEWLVHGGSSGPPSDSPLFERTWWEPGLHTVGVVVIDDYGKREYTSLLVDVGPRRNDPPPGPDGPRPTALLDVTPNPAGIGEAVTFSAARATSPNGSGAISTYDWNLDGQPGYEVTTSGPQTTRTYAEAHEALTVGVRVTDETGSSDTEEAALRVVDGHAPTAVLGIDPNPASAGQTVSFTGYGSTDPDNDIALYEWDLDGIEGYEEQTTLGYTERTYAHNGVSFPVRLRVIDSAGRSSIDTKIMGVGTGSPLRGAREPRYSRARPFSATVEERRKRQARFRAQLGGTAKLARAEKTLKLFLGSSWSTRADRPRTDRKNGVARVRALVLATAPRRRGQVCLQLDVSLRARQLPRGTFKVLGGTGDGARLYADGTYRFKLEDRKPATALGTLRAGTGTPRGLPRACRKLGR